MDSHTPEWIVKLATPESVKTLAIALVTSFFTVCLIEPIKAAIQRRGRKRELRRSLDHEMVLNHNALLAQVELAGRMPEMKNGIGDRFQRGFKKSSFAIAQHDPSIYYTLGYEERYWIELLYSGMENIIKGYFESDEYRFRAASFNAGQLLTYVKNRYGSVDILSEERVPQAIEVVGQSQQ
ncbi:MAG: hypothetical protein WB780_08360, partial [Candidatus Acidiferrales bacterium]